MSKYNFISAISSYNRELFHSKAITWLLNQFPEFRNTFLKSILDKKEYTKAIFIKALSELRQIDILVIIKIDEKYKFIHLENKIKASESTKKINTSFKVEVLSQTEYYFLRLRDKKFRIDLAKEINYKIQPHVISELNLKTEPDCYWNFIFLKPSHSLKSISRMDKLNNWRQDIWEVGEVINPWVTKSYQELVIDSLAKTKDIGESVKEYALLLNSEFTSSEKNLKHESFLNYDNVKKAVNDKMNIIEKSTLEEWFKNLEKKLNETYKVAKLGNQYSPLGSLGFEAKFITDSGNNGGFLIEAYYLISNFNFTINKEKDIISTARIGLQYEHTSKSAKMKFFFAAHDYDKVIIANKENRESYNKKVKNFLSKNNFKALNDRLTWDDKFNGSKGKTFCSRAIDIENIKDYKGFEDLNDLFQLHLRLLFEDLNKINNKVWRKFSQSNEC